MSGCADQQPPHLLLKAGFKLRLWGFQELSHTLAWLLQMLLAGAQGRHASRLDAPCETWHTILVGLGDSACRPLANY